MLRKSKELSLAGLEQGSRSARTFLAVWRARQPGKSFECALVAFVFGFAHGLAQGARNIERPDGISFARHFHAAIVLDIRTRYFHVEIVLIRKNAHRLSRDKDVFG